MPKRIITFLTLITLATPVLAQTDAAPAMRRQARETERTERKEVRQNVREDKQEVRAEIKEKQTEARDELKDKRAEVRQEMQVKRVEIRDELKVKREAIHAELKVKKEQFQTELKARREEFKTKREEEKAKLKKSLQKIKDERKKQVVEKIDAELHALNERMLAHFSNVLDKLSGALLRVKERADRAQERGINAEGVRGVILQADIMIDASRAAVAAQSAKTYTVAVTSEENLRVDVGAVRKALHDDLAAVRATVQAAHQAVRGAAVQLAQIPRVDEEDEEAAASSATQEPAPAHESETSNSQ